MIPRSARTCAVVASLLGLVVQGLLAGCYRGRSNKEDPSIVAVVNGEALLRTDFEAELRRELAAMPAVVSPEQLAISRRTLLDSSIDRLLLLQAAKAHGISVPAEEIDRQVLRMSSDFPPAGFEEALASGQLSAAEFQKRVASLLTIEKLFQLEVYPRVAATEAEITAYYEAHPEKFEHPEQVRAQQIVVKGLDDARKILGQLRAGKKFGELARRHSLSADAKVGGDLGWFERGTMPAKFDEVAFRLEVGQLSDVVESEYGYHVFQLLDRRPAEKLSLVEARRQVEQQLLESKRREAQDQFLANTKARAVIRIHETVLQTITGAPPSPEQGDKR